MTEDEEHLPRRPKASQATALHEVGQALDTLSVAELDEHIAQLRAEILRIEAARNAKAASLAAADAFFKK